MIKIVDKNHNNNNYLKMKIMMKFSDSYYLFKSIQAQKINNNKNLNFIIDFFFNLNKKKKIFKLTKNIFFKVIYKYTKQKQKLDSHRSKLRMYAIGSRVACRYAGLRLLSRSLVAWLHVRWHGNKKEEKIRMKIVKKNENKRKEKFDKNE